MPTPLELYKEHEELKEQDKLEEAIGKLEEAIEADSAFAMAHLGLAVLLGRVGRHDQAVEHGKTACELEPDDSFNFTAMSVTYQRAYAGTQETQYVQLAEDAMARAHQLQGQTGHGH